MNARRDEDFTGCVQARLAWLRRVAYLLCQDWQQADDLVQTAITSLYVHWRRARAMESIDGYARTILVRAFLSERRGGWARRVTLVGKLPDTAGQAPDAEDALDVRSALAGLPPRQRGSTLLRRRRWAIAAAPLLAAAAVAATVLGIGAITGTGGGPGIKQIPSARPVHHPFNPLAPYAAFGWLPKGVPHYVNSPYSTLAQLQLAVGSPANGNFELTVWARGTCNLDAAQVRADLRRQRHPLLDCEDAKIGWAANMSRRAPAVGGRPGFWFDGRMLAWEYARHAWATLYVSRRGTAIPAATIVKVAAHVRFAATAKPVVKFPFQLTGLPTSWRVISVAWRATVDGLLVSTSRELGSSTTVGRADGPVTGTIGYIAITPGKSKCPFFRGSSEGSSKRVSLGGVTAIVTHFTASGAPPYQGLCIPEVDGLHVSFLEYQEPGRTGFAFGGVTGVFTHHLRLLGPDPVNWTTQPIG